VEIAFDLAATARARLGIFDLKGALVRVLVDADLAAGHQSVTWDGRDNAGRALPSGAYVARFEAGDVRQSHKLMLVR
jgi:flagellar hook assembly protein FlgD